MTSWTRGRESGVVLALVLVLALMLSVSMIGFARRAVVVDDVLQRAEHLLEGVLRDI